MEDSQSKVLIVVTLRVCITPNENQVIGIKLLERLRAEKKSFIDKENEEEGNVYESGAL